MASTKQGAIKAVNQRGARTCSGLSLSEPGPTNPPHAQTVPEFNPIQTLIVCCFCSKLKREDPQTGWDELLVGNSLYVKGQSGGAQGTGTRLHCACAGGWARGRWEGVGWGTVVVLVPSLLLG